MKAPPTSINIESLPDDVLAYIFESFHAEYWREQKNPHYSPTILSSVSKRFRRIALHLPALWEEISSESSPNWTLTLKSRCRHPRIFVNVTCQRGLDFGRTLPQLSPNSRWRELNIEYDEEILGEFILEGIDKGISEPFEALTSFSIANRGDDTRGMDTSYPLRAIASLHPGTCRI